MDIDWPKMDGLVPAIVQDADSGEVLMLAWMNPAALERTTETGRVTFYSRSRQTLWTKGETSGNVLELVDLAADCDGDTLLVTARPAGPTCHQGTRTCWGEERRVALSMLGALDRRVAERAVDRPEGSYTTSLFEAGARRIAQKVGEEGVEMALAIADGDDDEVCSEAADLLYHLIVALRSRGLGVAEVARVLEERHRP